MAQRSLISIVTSVCAELNLQAPAEVVSSDQGTIKKILYLIRATCDDLLAEQDWQVLQRRRSFTTTNGEDEYDFPVDCDRFTSGTFFDQTNRWPLQGPLTPTEWEWLKNTEISSLPYMAFRLMGDKMVLYPTPGSSSATVVLEYVSNYYVLTDGTLEPKADFDQDSDICAFDHRVVIYGTKLKFLASAGLDTTAALAEFNRALEFSKGSDVPGQRLHLGVRRGVPLLSTRNYRDGNWA